MQRRKKRNESEPELAGALGLEELHATVLMNEESYSESESQGLDPSAGADPDSHAFLFPPSASQKSQSLKAAAGGESAVPSNTASRNMQILFQQFKGFAPSNALAIPLNERRFLPICNPKNFLRKLGFHADSVFLGSLRTIVYDRNTASVPGFHLPLVLDMVRDSVKNRLLNVLGFACIFCSVVLILSSFIFVSPQPAIPHKVCIFFLMPYLNMLTTSRLFLLSDRLRQSTKFPITEHQLR